MADTRTPAPAAARAAATPTAEQIAAALVAQAKPPADPGPMKRVVAVAALHGGTPAEPVTVAPGAATDLPEKEAIKLVALGLARWPGEAAEVVSSYDESIKDTSAKAGQSGDV